MSLSSALAHLQTSFIELVNIHVHCEQMMFHSLIFKFITQCWVVVLQSLVS